MEFKHEEKTVPTFRQWGKTFKPDDNDRFPIVRIFCNPEWRAITFVTESFRITRKLPTTQEFESVVKKLGKIVCQHCQANVVVRNKTEADISLLAASDADEHAVRFESDDFGYVRQ